MPTARKALVGREGERDWEGWRGREILGGERLKKERNFTELKSFVGTHNKIILRFRIRNWPSN